MFCSSIDNAKLQLCHNIRFFRNHIAQRKNCLNMHVIYSLRFKSSFTIVLFCLAILLFKSLIRYSSRIWVNNFQAYSYFLLIKENSQKSMWNYYLFQRRSDMCNAYMASSYMLRSHVGVWMELLLGHLSERELRKVVE